jgi:hypothetical protein
MLWLFLESYPKLKKRAFSFAHTVFRPHFVSTVDMQKEVTLCCIFLLCVAQIPFSGSADVIKEKKEGKKERGRERKKEKTLLRVISLLYVR